jgi:phospholipase C
MGVMLPVTEAQTQHLANQPFAMDHPKGFNTALDVITRNLWHLFYRNLEPTRCFRVPRRLNHLLRAIHP